MTKGFDEKIKKLKALEVQLANLTAKKEALRAEVFAYFEKESLDQYKVEGVATIARVTRKTIKFERPASEILEDIKRQNLVKYIISVPQQIIEAHDSLNTTFDKDIKEGNLTIEGVTVESQTSIMARFEK
jgi:restriction endonuclease S subunit